MNFCRRLSETQYKSATEGLQHFQNMQSAEYMIKGEIQMNTNFMTTLSRQRGMLPDRYWYQLNGKTATENYSNQKQPAEDDEELIIASEVKIK